MGNDAEKSIDLPASPEADAIESQIPRISHFGNGGRVEVHRIDVGRVYFAVFHSGMKVPDLCWKTIPEFIRALAVTTKKHGIAKDG